MAQRSTIHRIHIELADTDRQVYETIQMSIARADSETAHRLVARLIAYCVWFEEGIAFTGGVGAGDEPDVWVRDSDGRVRVWIEVGLPDSARLAKAARHSARVVVLAYGKSLPRWEKDHLASLQSLSNITVAELDPALLEALVARLDRIVSWELTVSGGALYLTTSGAAFEGTLRPLCGVLPGPSD